MAENNFSKNVDAFLQMQNQYLEMWNNASQNSSAQPASSPWPSNMENFWSTMSAQNTSSSQLFGDMHKQNAMMSSVNKCFEEIINATKSTDKQAPEQWQTRINKSLDDLQSQLSSMGSIPFTAIPEMTNGWAGLLSIWQQSMTSQNSGSANPFFNLWMNNADTTASVMPGLGPDREKYEKMQNLQALVQTYQAAMQEYTDAFSRFWPDVIEQLKEKIHDTMRTETDNSDGNDTPFSISMLYKLWTDAAEDAYAKTTGTDAYQQCYGKMINAAMALKKATNEAQQDVLTTMNIPTRKEIDTLSERLQRTRRENRQLRSELDALKTAVENIQSTSAKRKPEKNIKTDNKKKTIKKKAAKRK